MYLLLIRFILNVCISKKCQKQHKTCLSLIRELYHCYTSYTNTSHKVSAPSDHLDCKWLQEVKTI